VDEDHLLLPPLSQASISTEFAELSLELKHDAHLADANEISSNAVLAAAATAAPPTSFFAFSSVSSHGQSSHRKEIKSCGWGYTLGEVIHSANMPPMPHEDPMRLPGWCDTSICPLFGESSSIDSELIIDQRATTGTLELYCLTRTMQALYSYFCGRQELDRSRLFLTLCCRDKRTVEAMNCLNSTKGKFNPGVVALASAAFIKLQQLCCDVRFIHLVCSSAVSPAAMMDHAEGLGDRALAAKTATLQRVTLDTPLRH
jgi:hypothetical protein